MEDVQIARMLEHLRSPEAERAWAEFLQSYSPLILQVIRLFERDADFVGDGYLHVCEQLCRNRFRRLCRFHSDGRASFRTWLRVVVHNLCLDWHRREFGRERLFESVARLPALDRAVFRCFFDEGLSPDQTVLSLRSRYPALTKQQVEESHERHLRFLSPRQLWLLSIRKAIVGKSGAPIAELEEAAFEQIPDGRPDPESLAALSEQRAALARAVARLENAERLLIQLRFEQSLTLEQIARITGLPDAQTADRRVKAILGRLRKEIT